MYVPIGPVVSFRGIPSYSAFAVADREQTREYLLSQWSTPEQRKYNANHTTCGACRGRGYAVYRRSGVTIRESVGCQRCGGLGAVRIEEFQSLAPDDRVV